MEIIQVTSENLEREHICCAISNNKDCQVMSKKSWLARRFEDGLVFKKGDARGKCFIEYVPAEKAWSPILADNYLCIDCLWVSGQFKGQGYANLLLNECLADCAAQGKSGVVALSSAKKRPFLSDGAYLRHKGFELADTADPFFELLYLPLRETSEKPRFRDCVKAPNVQERGFVLYYADQCPYTAKYVPIVEAAAKQRNAPFHSIHVETTEQAQNAPTPFTSYTMFYDGAFVTNEILSPTKFDKLLTEKGF